MPDGRVQRIDERNDLIYVIRRGRTFAADLADVDTKARVPNARVRFDLVRRQGSERATNVRLRSGTRTSRRQRRFGDLTGARRPGAKAPTIAARSYGIDVTTQPFRVAEAWIRAVADSDHDGATSLYLSGAALHTETGSGSGRRHVRAELERLDLRDIDVDGVEIHGLDRQVMVDFDDRGGQHTTALLIEHGHIVEQWIDVDPPESDLEPADELPTIEFVHRGPVPASAESYAEKRIQSFVENSDRPCRYARMKLTAAENPAVDRPAMAQATVELERFALRAHSTAPTFTEATDQVIARLAAQLESHRDRERLKPHGQVAAPGSWRHANLARTEKPYFDRPVGEREIVRHKSFAADELTIDEAAWDMAMLDYDFFLFVELTSGQDSLIERRDDGALVVHHLDQGVDRGGDADVESGASSLTSGGATTTIDYERAELSPPELAVSQAIELLNESGARLLFFRNLASGRGNVVYRRYDGHYGLLTPPTDDSAMET